MENNLVPIDPTVMALIHGSFEQNALKPFAREIMLVECQIAGTSYENVESVEPSLSPGALLVLRREPLNAHDNLTISVFDEAGHRLGYVPRAKNEALARLMDAGKLLFAKLQSKQWMNDWLKAEITIYMRDF